MKSWIVKASLGIISVKQESHIIAFYKNEHQKQLQEKLTTACNNDTTHTMRMSQ